MKRSASFVARRAALAALPFLASPLLSEASAPAAGPDVTVITLGSTSNWGAVGGIRGYSVGTTSCNIGAAPVAWCDSASCLGGTLQRNDHPVIAQNIYRLKDGRFEQIGMSWLKHGWLSTNSFDSACGSCSTPPGGGDQLGVGCTDTYNSTLNGGSGNPGTCDGATGEGCRLGQRSVINSTTGDFAMPYPDISHPSAIHQRIQVAETDVNPALNPDALYWVEGQYIAADDAAAGNSFNNASYRLVTVGASPFSLSLQDSTVRDKTAIAAWQATDEEVRIVNADVPGAIVERFEIARKVAQIGADTWHYEYAVRNMNSDRALQRFAIDFPNGTLFANLGFKDIDHHSDEPYSTTDWTGEVDAPTSTVSWFTETHAANPAANALRFATMFNFWFDADRSPSGEPAVLTLFKPGTPESVTIAFDLFLDDFESGDTSAWSLTAP